ncbi:MAG: cation:proton antiporter [Geodermatophilaceae bacterium]|nr:cation:proton antiporter [Geodermatophilaceae bacterium]
MEELSPAEIAAFVLLDIAVIIIAARLFGRAARALRQPAVIGEIVAGIALGPSLLGALPGNLTDVLFPEDVRPYLYILAQLGLILFMFIVGLELDVGLIRGRERVAGAISLCSVVLPFALGAGLTLILHPLHDEVGGEPVTLLALALFIGVAMSITAFPVLARILGDRGMHRTPAGVMALACAAFDDILAWTLLAFVVAVARGESPFDVVRIVGLTVVFAAAMFLGVKPLLRRLTMWHQAAGRLTPDVLAVVLIGVLLSGYATDRIGIHSIFGAFIFGAIMPREGAAELTRDILERLEQVSVLLLLPVFFVIAGLGTNIGGLGLDGLWQLGLILAVAIGGKFIGAYSGARMLKLPGRQASVIGVLMNTRGLTELVILQIGRDLGVLDGELFTMLVLMALITTTMTEPLLRLVYPERILRRDIEAAERASLGIVDAYQVLTVVDEPARAHQLIDLGCDLLGNQSPSGLVLDRLVPAPRSQLEVGSGLLPDLAAMASAVDELKALTSTASARGVTTNVLSRFSSDPWADLASQAEIVDADVVLVSEAWSAARAGGPTAEAAVLRTLVTVRLGAAEDGASPDRPVVVAADITADGRTALRLATQMALQRRSALWVLDSSGSGRGGRRLAAAVEQIRRAGLEARLVGREEAAHADASALVLPAGPAAGDFAVGLSFASVLTVRAGQADADLDLTEALTALLPDEALQPPVG